MEIRHLGQQEEAVMIAAGEEIFLWDDGLSASVRIETAPQAKLYYFSCFDPGSEGPAEVSRELSVAAGSTVTVRQAYFGDRSYRSYFKSRIGAGAVLDQRALSFVSSGQEIRLDDKHDFSAPGSRAAFRSDGLVAGSGRSECWSEIIIRPQAQETETRIDLQLHLLGPEAKGTVLPSLLIEANRVKAGHSARTFNFQPEDLFYLRSRGLSVAQARSLAVTSAAEAFAADLPAEVQEIITASVRKRLAHLSL